MALLLEVELEEHGAVGELLLPLLLLLLEQVLLPADEVHRVLNELLRHQTLGSGVSLGVALGVSGRRTQQLAGLQEGAARGGSVGAGCAGIVSS